MVVSPARHTARQPCSEGSGRVPFHRPEPEKRRDHVDAGSDGHVLDHPSPWGRCGVVAHRTLPSKGEATSRSSEKASSALYSRARHSTPRALWPDPNRRNGSRMDSPLEAWRTAAFHDIALKAAIPLSASFGRCVDLVQCPSRIGRGPSANCPRVRFLPERGSRAGALERVH